MDQYENLALVTLNEYDIHGLIDLSHSVGWDYDEEEVRTVLNSGHIIGLKNSSGVIVSSAAIIPYDTHLASIGMVIVHKDYRGQGLGRKVTQACIDMVEKNISIMLIATPDGRALYERMGFKEVGDIHKFTRSHTACLTRISHEGLIAEAMSENDINKVFELDRGAFGDGRKKFIENRIQQSHRSLTLKDLSGNIIGYGLSVLGPENLILGPIVVPDCGAASFLLSGLAAGHQGNLRIDVPNSEGEFMRFLEEHGFKKVSQPPLMIINSDEMPYRNNHLFGIAAQIFG